MRSSISRLSKWALNQMTSVLIRREDTGRRKGHTKMKAEFGGMQSQTKEPQSDLKLEEAKKDPPLKPSEGVWPY